MKKHLLLETDQTRCFDSSGHEINCKHTGQDGEFNIDTRVQLDRFNIIGNEVEDRWTGLRWHQNANLPEFPLNWSEALNFIEALNPVKTSGNHYWRLPTRSELFTLISHRHTNPTLPENHPFDNVFNGYYWTQTECARLPDQAWYIHLGGGRVYRGMKHGSYLVWPVSGPKFEKCSGNDRFFVHENLFYDRLTQRTWSGVDLTDTGQVSWNEAINRVAHINDKKMAGYSDWRLPNIRELESLIDTAKHTPAIASNFSIGKMQDGYWSATTSIYEPRYAWVLYTRDGAVGVGYKPRAEFSALAVR